MRKKIRTNTWNLVQKKGLKHEERSINGTLNEMFSACNRVLFHSAKLFPSSHCRWSIFGRTGW